MARVVMGNLIMNLSLGFVFSRWAWTYLLIFSMKSGSRLQWCCNWLLPTVSVIFNWAVILFARVGEMGYNDKKRPRRAKAFSKSIRPRRVKAFSKSIRPRRVKAFSKSIMPHICWDHPHLFPDLSYCSELTAWQVKPHYCKMAHRLVLSMVSSSYLGDTPITVSSPSERSSSLSNGQPRVSYDRPSR